MKKMNLGFLLPGAACRITRKQGIAISSWKRNPRQATSSTPSAESGVCPASIVRR